MIASKEHALVLVLVPLLGLSGGNAAPGVMAGVKKVNSELPKGVPLAGYNHGDRRHELYPLPDFGNYTTWMTGNVGVRDTNWVKALVVETDDGTTKTRVAWVTTDSIGSDGSMGDKCWAMAAAQGFGVPRENTIFSASHTHSGPGALSPEFLWAIAPATDLLVPSLLDHYCGKIVEALLEAEKNMEPAKIDAGSGTLTGVTKNRRAPNPWVSYGTIDPHLGVFRVDRASDGKPLATLWNYAIHGTCYGPSNMEFSSDISGASCDAIEKEIGGVALFTNADAGDIDPTSETCDCVSQDKCLFAGAAKIADAVEKTRATLKPTSDAKLTTASSIVPFGRTKLNITLGRWDNCTSGGELDICTICRVLDCDANIELPESWVEENPRFTGVRLDANGKKTVMVTIPGEALVELGWVIRNDTFDLGFDNTFLLGYSNSHMGYFATPNEYDWGGYESQLTFWGIGTSAEVANGCKLQASKLKEQSLRSGVARRPLRRQI